MRFLAIITFTAVAIGAQCRSVTPSTERTEGEHAACMEVHRGARVHRDANQDAPSSSRTEPSAPRGPSNVTDERAPPNAQPRQLKDLFASYEENFAQLTELARRIGKNKSDARRETQFQNRLESLIEQFVKEQFDARSVYAKLDNVTDAISRASASDEPESVANFKDLLDTVKELDIVYQDGEITDEHIRIKRTASEGCKGAAPFVISDREERLDNILTDIQRQLVQIRKYLNKLCKKHHLTPTTTLNVDSDDDGSPVSPPNKISII